LYHSLMDLYSRKGDADNVVGLLNKMIETSNPPPNQHSFGYAISSLKKKAAAGSGTVTTTRKTAALQALELFKIMVSDPISLPPNSTIYNELIDCFGKAGDVDQAFKLFHRAVVLDKIQPTAHTFSILIKACAVAKQPDRANDVVFKLMPQHGLEPGTSAWNGLLGAAAGTAGGSVDRAYEVWQKMNDAGIVPDMHTERVLARAFASHPQLAAELVSEARILTEESKKEKIREKQAIDREINGEQVIKNTRMSGTLSQRGVVETQQRDSQPTPPPAGAPMVAPTTLGKQQPILLDELQRKKQNVSAHALGLAPDLASSFFMEKKDKGKKGSISRQRQRQQPPDEEDEEKKDDEDNAPFPYFPDYNKASTSAINLPSLLSLDLHGHSQAAAEMTLLCRLEALVEAWPEIQKSSQHAQHATDNIDDQFDNSDATNAAGLIIITGVGKGSRDGIGVLKHAVREMLKKQGLSAHDVPTNPGRLFIPFTEISNFAEKQWERMQREHIYAAARARYATVGVGVAGVVAAAVIIPRLGPWLL
jgi:pentatricopeptide repeat protein